MTLEISNDALLEQYRLQLGVALDALRERDRKAAEQAEWDFALQLQMEGLPQDFPAFPDHTEFDLRAGMVTAQEVGGDFYDFFLLDQDRLAIMVADASGKGLPAAVFISQTRTLLRAAASRVADPGECLTVLNALMAFDNIDAMFVTVFYGVLNLTDGRLQYANAGHPMPLLVRPDNTMSVLPGRRRPILGVKEDLVYTSQQVALAPGETVVCFTDGVTEAHDTAKELFGDARLEAVLANAGAQSLETVLAEIIGAVDQFMGLAPVADDVTLLLLRWIGR